MLKIKVEDPVKDYIGFVDALDQKFNFKNKKSFEKDLFNMISDMNIEIGKTSEIDLKKAESDFFELIKRHSIDFELEKNYVKAQEEIRNLELWLLK